MALAVLAWPGEDDASIEQRLARCSNDDCRSRVYDDAAKRGEVARALAALRRLADRGDLDDCHLEAHRLAHAVFRVVGDVERTFLLGGPQCRFGYFHGAVEASRASSVPDCARFRTAAERGACAHGYGHALMLRTRHDLRASLEGCRAALEHEACELGVMMQNSLRFAGQSDFARVSARACDAVRGARRLSRLCFDNIGVVAALSTGHDPSRAEAACRPLPVAARADCVRGARAEIAEQGRAD